MCIVVAALLGGAIGLEREYRSKEAGFRTHFLVGLGSGLLMVLSMHGFDDFMGIQGIQRDPRQIAFVRPAQQLEHQEDQDQVSRLCQQPDHLVSGRVMQHAVVRVIHDHHDGVHQNGLKRRPPK